MVLEYFVKVLYYFLGLNLVGIALLSSLRLLFIKKSSASDYTELKSQEPFVSIHFPICNEPYQIVLETLDSFYSLDYKNFEVIIISNNTTNTNSWKPTESYCSDKPNFKFFHFDEVKGYKAGALNIASDKADVAADYIFTVDSDYKLHPNALRIAVGSIQSREVDLLQFPQDYRNTCSNTEGLQVNYKHYFECYLSPMDVENFGLPTGTLTLIDAKIFTSGFLWPTETITEDAHFGVELLSKNFKIGYCNYCIGMGTMPTTIKDYNKQFKRWIFGNFQTLIISLKKPHINTHKKLRLFTMLTAWINLLAIPILVAFIALPFSFKNIRGMENVYFLIVLSLIVHILTQLYILRITSENNFGKSIKALLIHIGTIEIGSFHWLTYFKNPYKPFNRTNKYLTPNRVSLRFFLMPLVLFVYGLACLILNSNVIGLILLIISIMWLAGKLELIFELYHSKYNLSKIFKS